MASALFSARTGGCINPTPGPTWCGEPAGSIRSCRLAQHRCRLFPPPTANCCWHWARSSPRRSTPGKRRPGLPADRHHQPCLRPRRGVTCAPILPREYSMSGKPQTPAIDGWHTMASSPHLIGTRCRSCGTYSFPKQAHYCRNPDCEGTEFEELELSRTGHIWSYTNACYKPPEPYVAAEPFTV